VLSPAVGPTTSLTAATTATAAATAAATLPTFVTAAETRRCLTFASHVHVERTTVDFAPIQRFDRALRVVGVLELDEAEAAGLTRHSVSDD
jgi:hypothetical protein